MAASALLTTTVGSVTEVAGNDRSGILERRQAMKNGEGYPDPTAGQAIANAGKMPRYIKNIFRALNTVASIHGLEITELRDVKTGRKYRG